MPTQISRDLQTNIEHFNLLFAVDKNFDILTKTILIGDKRACLYIVTGFSNDTLIQRVLEYLYCLDSEKTPDNAYDFSKTCIPFASTSLASDEESIVTALLSGLTCLFIDGFNSCILIECRAYPARGVQEPDKDKVLRGSRDGFVEALMTNAALIRRRIRDPKLILESFQVGERSSTDIAVTYISDRVDHAFLEEVKERISNLKVDALSMNHESLAECLYPYKWINPFPKFKYSERPDTAAAAVLEGNIVILIDNSPSCMILPSSLFDIIEEADDYYFPPVTGTYLRIIRFIITFLTVFTTPLWLLLTMNPEWLPSFLEFTKIKEVINIPLYFQLLILEFGIDGLKLAAVNTPNMLSTPLSVITGLVLGEFSVKSGWFNSETMLYMAFVALANYTQSSYELGYALKFMRLIILTLTALFNAWGFFIGSAITILAIVLNKTISGHSYIYPLIPLDWKNLSRRFFRMRLPHTVEKK